MTWAAIFTMSNAERHAQALADYINGIPTMMHSGHAEKLKYGWWERKRGHVLLPRTLGQKNNYVITHEELCAYDLELVAHSEWVKQERERVLVTLKTIRAGKQMYADPEPTCFTIAHILESMINIAKFKLGVMKVLHYIVQERLNEQRSNRQAHESPSSTNPG
jgi:hypothetical protein